MEETLRDSPIGQLHFLSNNRLLQYPEERADFYAPKDPANPQNWSNGRQNFVCTIICLYTFVVYCGSAIYITSQKGVQEQFGVSTENSSLPLSLYVLAYGVGPLLWAPLSEIPIVGRNPVYAVTFSLFLLILIPTSIGFLGSPCLANGAATLGDMFNLFKLPYGIALWTTAAYCGLALGHLLFGFAIMDKSWRWSLWEIKNIKPVLFFVNSIIKLIEIIVKDLAIFFVNIYTPLVYGIYYSFFEAFPIVYMTYYGFNISEPGIAFTCVIILKKNGMRPQEHRLIPALFACFGPPAGLFLFSWTSAPSIHWIVLTIGIVIIRYLLLEF
ncbi:major facilitator superfamily domain-containing protein [Leptodontidium sp. 2 PMI_412]|nr:major facilitator superfamily domain-containing protein [Leptodontidium sp. 2 PMI_412]